MTGIQMEVQRAAVAPEAAFGVAGDFSTDGLWVPAQGGFLPENQRAVRQRNYASGRNVRNKHWTGRASAQVAFGADLHGYYTSQLTDGQPPPAITWLDVILQSILGNPIEANSDATLATTSVSQVAMTDAITPGQLVAIRNAAVNGGRAQWAALTGASSPFAATPNFAVNPGTGAAIAAVRTYYPKILPGTALDVGPSYTLAVDLDGEERSYPGCRASALSFSAVAGEDASLQVTHMADRELVGAVAGFPAMPFASLPEPAFFVYSEVMVNGVALEVANVSIDLRPQVRERRASRGENGRSDFRVRSVRPVITIDPVHHLDRRTLFENGTEFPFQVVIGRGDLANGRLNQVVFNTLNAQIVSPVNQQSAEDDIRDSITIEPADSGLGIPWAIGIV